MGVRVTILARVEHGRPHQLGWVEIAEDDDKDEAVARLLEELAKTIRGSRRAVS